MKKVALGASEVCRQLLQETKAYNLSSEASMLVHILRQTARTSCSRLVSPL
jgi:hypothetical protein